MRILFDQCVYDLRNKGNVALLQVALSRVSKLWPRAELRVITSAPYLLGLYCPGATPISPDGSFDWCTRASPLRGFIRHLPREILLLLFEAREEVLRRRFAPQPPWKGEERRAPVSFFRASRRASEIGPGSSKFPAPASNALARLMKDVDLFVATGAQYMSDACKPDALRLLDRLEMAKSLGKRAVMVGQGVGPMHDAELTARARAVLPLADYIFVRETRSAPQLLDSLGVPPARVLFTGDDAIQLAFDARRPGLGAGIGVSMRLTNYTDASSGHLDALGPVLRRCSNTLRAPLVSLPISHSSHEQDDAAISRLLVRHRKTWVDPRRFGTPLEVIRNVGRCRLVVTGTFHAALFALAQGIPAIGLARSEMYMDKFLGLLDQFGPGFQIVCLDDGGLQEKLSTAISDAWKSAQQLRPLLLEVASRQIALGQSAYDRLPALVGEPGNPQ